MPDNEAVIRRGRACVRLIEAVDVLARDERGQDERNVLLVTRRLAVRRLRQLVADGDSAITSQIIAASAKRLGTVKAVMLN